MIEFTRHARLKMQERGAVESEVILTIQMGDECAADPPKLCKEMVFRDGYEWEGKLYKS